MENLNQFRPEVNIVPVLHTKEQREFLFQKMKEAGYEWDAEKKELKKVKKVPQKFMVGDTIKYNGTEYKITEITPNGYKVYALTYDEDAASLISFGAPAILVEQKPAEWSEEDEQMVEDILGAIDTDYAASDYHEMEDWLKSLKGRVQPQTTWKPSDEQMAQLKKYCPDNRPLTSLYEQLKKLKRNSYD